MDAVAAVGPVLVEQFQRPDGPSHAPGQPRWASCSRRIAVVDRDGDLLQPGAQDVAGDRLVDEPAVGDQDGKVAGRVQDRDDVVDVLADQRLAAGQRDDQRAQPVQLPADQADVVQR